MTTLAANTPRSYELGTRNAVPVIASDIIYEGAAVGVVTASGHARPLAAGDRFAGFAEAKADNSSGAAAAINVKVIESGMVQLSVSGSVITDVGQPVYATDDNAFVFLPTGAVFIGFMWRHVSAGVCIVAFDALSFEDPWKGGTYETITGNKTLDAEDCGKIMFVTADANVALPATATPALPTLVCAGAYGTVEITISPAALDSLEGPDITAADDKDVVNTKATAQRGDFAVLGHADAVGHTITELRGTWARQA